MLDRFDHDTFDHDANQTLARARDCALEMNHKRIGSEHMLLGLLGDDQITDLLFRMGMTKTDIRVAVDERIVRGARPSLDDELPLTPEAHDVIASTLEESTGFGHLHVRNAHLLLGLVKEPDGVGGRVLEGFGSTLDGMRHEVLEYMAEIDV